mgnify:CR=1 FL=1
MFTSHLPKHVIRPEFSIMCTRLNYWVSLGKQGVLCHGPKTSWYIAHTVAIMSNVYCIYDNWQFQGWPIVATLQLFAASDKEQQISYFFLFLEMLRDHGIVRPMLLYTEQKQASAVEVMKMFKVQYSIREYERDKEEAVYTNLEAFMSLMQGKATIN